MKVVALVRGTRIEITGKTQKIETLTAELPLYESIMKRELLHPPAMLGTFYPDPNTALAFLSVLENWKYFTKRTVEILECEDIEEIPFEEGVVY